MTSVIAKLYETKKLIVGGDALRNGDKIGNLICNLFYQYFSISRLWRLFSRFKYPTQWLSSKATEPLHSLYQLLNAHFICSLCIGCNKSRELEISSSCKFQLFCILDKKIFHSMVLIFYLKTYYYFYESSLRYYFDVAA